MCFSLLRLCKLGMQMMAEGSKFKASSIGSQFVGIGLGFKV